MQQNFHSSLERDILRLSQEVRNKQESVPRPSVSERDLLGSVLQARMQQAQPAPAPATPSESESQVLPRYLSAESPEIQLKVEELADLAFEKGIDAAITEAKRYDPFMLDALHDTLTAKLYDELKSRKLL
ncbi:hypothetical protein KGO95_00720 [Patescibacteria group bacterium]|nr:hypothetical protein [Patescibacteria group bacterium]